MFEARRRTLAERMGPRSVAVLAAPPVARRNADSEYDFRTSSDFYYLTGFPEPEAVLVLRPDGKPHPFAMFVLPRDRERETWVGRRAGPEGAVARYGADAAYPLGELDEKLLDYLDDADTLYFAWGQASPFEPRLMQILQAHRARRKKGIDSPAALVDPGTLVHEMRLLKSAEELAVLRRAVEASAEGHVAAMRGARPGMYEYELQAIVEHEFRRRGARACGYTTIVGAGANATILHYVTNDRRVEDGDLLLIDAGAEVGYYTGDITRTFPANGRFTPRQRAVYDVVLAAQQVALAKARPGHTLVEVHDAALRRLVEGMVALGLLQGAVDDLIKDKEEPYKRFYMHRTSHWLGLDVHDAGRYYVGGKSRELAPGMVITVEPGLYIAEDDEQAPPELRGIGVRIEDDVLITPDGHEVLSAAAPKEPDAIERLMAAGRELAATG